ncbi:MAG: hypothetical protein ABIP85_14720, partial [Chthoniobacteraceae bacterium]
DWVGSFTAAAGCAIYDGGTWPAEYNGDYFCTEPTINIIHHARLTPQGTSYTFHKLPGREETEFVRSKDMWWRPIEARIGPDGALYIADFYNQAVIHNDTRGPDHNKVNAAVRPDRDHYFGRIWKIDHKDAKKIAVPDLSKASVKELVAALEHPNKAVRMTASRLLVEREVNLPKRTRMPTAAETAADREQMEKDFGLDSLAALAINASKSVDARVAALWTIGTKGTLHALVAIGTCLSDKEPAIRRNAALLAEGFTFGQGDGITLNFVNSFKKGAPMAELLTDSDAQVRLAALRALASCNVPANATHKMARDISAYAARDIVAAWPKFDDDFQRSAAVSALAGYIGDAIPAILDRGDASLAPLASILVQNIGDKNDAVAAAKLVVSLATQPAAADALKRSILDTLGKSLKADPEMTPELSSALGKLLASGATSGNASLASSALPLAARWDKAGSLKSEVAKLSGTLLAQLADAKAADDARINAAGSLIGLRSMNAEILPAVISQLGRDGRAPFKRQLIVALGETGDAEVGKALAANFSKLPADSQTAAFDTVLKRSEWALAFLDAVGTKQIDALTLGPANAARLRT